MTIHEQILTMTDADLEAFPLGVARLDLQGTILFFNHAELALMNRKKEETEGLNYFRDVAPCAAVKEHQGRFGEFAATAEARSETFEFFYPFGFGNKRVTITMVRRRADEDTIFIVTEFSHETTVT
jgi:photoactive yellow protein